MEHLYEFPDHWLLQGFYIFLPPIGLAVVLDGIVRFSVHSCAATRAAPNG